MAVRAIGNRPIPLLGADGSFALADDRYSARGDAIAVDSGGGISSVFNGWTFAVIANSFTMGLPPAATLPVGWHVHIVQAVGGITTTLEAQPGETIDGALTKALGGAQSVTVYKSGAAFRTRALTGLWQPIRKIDVANVASIDLAFPPGSTHLRVTGAWRSAVSAQNLLGRTSVDGTTFPSGGADYGRNYTGSASTNDNAMFVTGNSSDTSSPVVFNFQIFRGDGIAFYPYLLSACVGYAGGIAIHQMAGYRNSSAIISHLRLFATSGNIAWMRAVAEAF